MQAAAELLGVALTYGETAQLPFGRERFVTGAFGDLTRADVMLNLQHDRRVPLARTGGSGLILDDNAQRLLIRAELPETRDADDTLTLVRNRVLRGLSIEFLPRKERFVMVDGKITMEIQRAKLTAVSVVDRPAYTKSVLKARWQEYEREQGQKGARKVWL